MKIPDTEHWAIITTSSVYIPGDERSRTNPGHGYPETYVETIEYESFSDYEKFKLKVERLTSRNESFRMIKAIPLKLKTEIIITIDGDQK
jgi:hypothetical protein